MSFNIENYISDQSEGKIIFYYKGNVDPDVINHILDSVEDKIVEEKEKSRLKKRIYNVLVESLQNLYHHVDRVPEDFENQAAERFGLLVVRKVEKGYLLTTGNFVLNENVEKLEEKIKRINRSSQDEIRELYKFILNHQRISAKGGGGLGLVDIARKTGNKLDYKFIEYNERYSFFLLNIFVSDEN